MFNLGNVQPEHTLLELGCLQEAAADIKGYGYRKALIVTDKILNQICSPPRKMKNVFAKNENPPQR